MKREKTEQCVTTTNDIKDERVLTSSKLLIKNFFLVGQQITVVAAAALSAEEKRNSIQSNKKLEFLEKYIRHQRSRSRRR